MEYTILYWMFESSVNSEGIETGSSSSTSLTAFESSVNSEGIETSALIGTISDAFESSVNSEGIETKRTKSKRKTCLRAV